jgi:DNA-binding CsgD family transcriptional regulator
LAGDIADELLPALPGPQREALEIALVRRASGSGRAPDPKAVGVGLRSMLVEAARSGPVVVALDDVQWLDAATAGALAFAARRLAGHPVGVLATVRVPLTSPDALGLDRAFGDRLTRARLGPLSLGALRVLLERRLGHEYRRPTLRRIAEVSAGNPLFALEIARALGPAPALEPGAPLPVPDSLRELVASRVAAVPEQARHALLAAAALSHPTVALVEAGSSADGLAAAEEAGLLAVEQDRVVFAHPLYASAVYTAARSGRRRTLHRRLAGLVADSEERVRHLALATARPDEDVAAALQEAAAGARARGAWEAAGELLEQARALTPPALPEAARARGVRAAEHHIHAGDRPRARALLEELLTDAPRGATRADALRLLAEIRYHEDSFAEAVALLDEAAEFAEDPALAVTIELNLSYVRCNHLGDFASADPHADRALAYAALADDDALLGEALGVRSMVDFLLGRGVDWTRVERALGLEDPMRLLPQHLRPATMSATLKLYVGRLPEAREELMALRATAIDSGDESDLAYVLFWLAWLETLSGDFEAAGSFAEEAAVHAALAGSRFNGAWALGQQALVHAHRGEVDLARTCAAEAAAIAQELTAMLPMLWVSAALGMLEVSLGNHAAAWQAVQPLTELLQADGVGEPTWVFVPEALEALIGLAELDRAERLLDDWERRAQELDRILALATAARCRGLLQAARGDLDAAEEALERSLVASARMDIPFERARTLLVQGQVRRRRRQKRAAREALEQALALFEPMGARVWAERTRDELARLGGRRRVPGALTPAELRVVELAVQGLSNKAIAQALFVSIHTVEVHLTHAYRKLEVSSRTQLAGRLGRGAAHGCRSRSASRRAWRSRRSRCGRVAGRRRAVASGRARTASASRAGCSSARGRSRAPCRRTGRGSRSRASSASARSSGDATCCARSPPTLRATGEPGAR